MLKFVENQKLQEIQIKQTLKTHSVSSWLLNTRQWMREFTCRPAKYHYLVKLAWGKNLLRDQKDLISLLNQNDKTFLCGSKQHRQYLRPRHCEKYMKWDFQSFSNMGMPCNINSVSRCHLFSNIIVFGTKTGKDTHEHGSRHNSHIGDTIIWWYIDADWQLQ